VINCLQIIDSIITNLTFAVFPVDDFTGEKPLGKIRVYLNGIKYEGVLNRSGYHLFLNLQDSILDDGNVLTIKSVQQYYQEKTKIFSKDEISANNLVFKVDLIPSASYPFAHNETLIKGTIMAETSNGLTSLKTIFGAKVELRARNLEAFSDVTGAFIFYFKNLKEEDIKEVDEKKFINMGGTNIFDLLITAHGYQPLEIPDCKAEIYKNTVVSVEPLEEV
jgi:hypothetical protein